MLAFNFVLWPSLLTAVLCSLHSMNSKSFSSNHLFHCLKKALLPKNVHSVCHVLLHSVCHVSYYTQFVMSELFMCFSLSCLNSMCFSCHVWTLYVFQLSCLNSLCVSVCHIWTLYVFQFVMYELFMCVSLSCLNSLCVSVCHVWTLYVCQFVMSVHCFCMLSFFLPFFLFFFFFF